MTEIAEAAGLQQSSIYYWFGSKEEILRAIMEQNRESLSAARALAPRSEPAAARLYIVLYQDVLQMCSAPLNFYELQDAAMAQPEVFADFQPDYAELFSLIRQLFVNGVQRGELRASDPDRFTRTALSLNEGSQHHYHLAQMGTGDISEVAHDAARMAVCSILTKPGRMPEIERLAEQGIGGYRAGGG